MYSSSSLLIHKDAFEGFCQQIKKQMTKKQFDKNLTN